MSYRDDAIPSIEGLIAFEAVARHRSFRRAGEELHLTTSAVSHRLRTLEAQLGVRLLTRTTRSVDVTAAGQAYLPSLRRALRHLQLARAALTDAAAAPVVTIETSDSIAACWLVRLLPSLHPEARALEVRLLTRPFLAPFDPASADLGIVYVRHDDRIEDGAELLVHETVYAVCSPALAASIEGEVTIAALLRLPLLHDENLPVDWAAFAIAAGADPADPAVVAAVKSGARVNYSHLALRAAAEGQGVALAGSPLADVALSRGELIRPLPTAIATGASYYLVRGERGDAARSSIVAAWLHEVARASPS